MALRKVNEGCEVYWPNGQVRASAGEVFDDLTDIEPQPAAAFMQSLAAKARLRTVSSVVAQGECADRPLPPQVLRDLTRRGWQPHPAGADAEDAPSPPRKQRSRKRTPSEDADA